MLETILLLIYVCYCASKVKRYKSCLKIFEVRGSDYCNSSKIYPLKKKLWHQWSIHLVVGVLCMLASFAVPTPAFLAVVLVHLCVWFCNSECQEHFWQ